MVNGRRLVSLEIIASPPAPSTAVGKMVRPVSHFWNSSSLNDVCGY